MIKYLQYIISSTDDPYVNLSLETYLLDHAAADTMILYLWKNVPSVFAGPDPDAFLGYSVSGLMEDGIMPVRRLSGGKALRLASNVLHYTFITYNENFDSSKQLSVIRKACQNPDCPAVFPQDADFLNTTDIYRNSGRSLQHGYLTFPKEILSPDLKANVSGAAEELLYNAILDSLDAEYGLKAESYPLETIDFSVLRSYEKVFGSEDWIYNGSE